MDHGDGQVVAFYSNDPSWNPAEVYNIYHKLLLKRMKINKRSVLGSFLISVNTF